jgi:2-alkenal reductase
MPVQDRLIRIALIVILLLLAAIAAQPFVLRLLYTQNEPRPVAPREDLWSIEKATIELFHRSSPSVVHIFARPDLRRLAEREYGSGSGGAEISIKTGSGFIWDEAGNVVTNNHVVEGALPLAVRLASGEIVSAQIVGKAPTYDLAVIRLERVRAPLRPIPMGTSTDLLVGQATFAIGNPFGLDHTLTTGIISALQRRLPTSEGREIRDVIQTNAAINPGNSGGPLLDSAGRLMGVNTAIFSPTGTFAGIGFAIPADVVNRVVPQLIRTGRVPTPGIGIVPAPESTTARLGIAGVLVVRAVPGLPAERAGLRGIDPITGEVGDIIVGVNGQPVQRVSDLATVLEQVGVGKPVELTILRGGRTRTVEVEAADVGDRAPL